MRVVISDITGRTLNYDYALCEAISGFLSESDIVEFWGPNREHSEKLAVRSFGSIVPNRYKTSTNTIVRLLKAFDTVLAYMKILLWVIKEKPDVFHLQWFPFLSLGTRGASIDMFFMRLIKKCSPQTKTVFTIHNMCPHGMSEDDRAGYNPIFTKALTLFDHYVVHTEKTKEEVISSFKIRGEKVSLIYHGVFKPKGVVFERKTWDENNVHLIMYGSQNWYKGTDVFVEALSLLPNNIKKRIQVTICGSTDHDISSKCRAINAGCDIDWMSYYIEDDLLYQKISEADIIFLPYRRISQSGVLLLALATKRLIVTSNLPTFKETLKGYNDEMFFESENPQSLASLICKYVDGVIDRDRVLSTLESLEKLYSWDESAKNTISLYNSMVGQKDQ